MDKTKPTFSINMVANPGTTRYGKPLPDFRGYVAAPDAPDRTFNVALWSTTFTDKDGVTRVALNGNVDGHARNDDAIDQIRASAARGAGTSIEINNIVLAPGKIVLFEAKHEDGNIADNGKRRTDFYGHWNLNGKRIDIGGWLSKNPNGQRASVVGRSQFPLSQDKPADFEPASDIEIAGFERAGGGEPDYGFDEQDRASR